MNGTETKDTSIIPVGVYCYTWNELPSEKNNFRGTINKCPYLKRENVNGVEFPWCDYLEKGGFPNGGKWAGWEDEVAAEKTLIEHFGSEEKMNEKLSLSLLFDLCKECNINE